MKSREPTKSEKERFPIEIEVLGERFMLSVAAAEKIADDLLCQVYAAKSKAMP